MANSSPNFQGEFARFTLIPWTTQEISLLIGLWPNASAAQISKQLNRSRGSECKRAMRLRRHDLLPADVEEHFKVNPAVQTRPGPAKTTETPIRPAKCRRDIDATVPPPEMRRCSLVELDDGQCRSPLGDLHQVVTYSAAAMRCQDFPIAGIICGWRDTIAVRNPIAVHTMEQDGRNASLTIRVVEWPRFFATTIEQACHSSRNAMPRYVAFRGSPIGGEIFARLLVSRIGSAW